MAAIILGSSPLSQDIGTQVPITIPVDTLPLRGVTILQNPLLIRMSSESSTYDYNWLRLSGNILRPRNTYDRVSIGGSNMLSDESLRVYGASLSTEYRLDSNTRLFIDNSGNLCFIDAVTGTATLAQLLAGGNVTASDVSVTDSGSYYISTDVEGVLQELGVNNHFHLNKALLDSYTQTDSDIIYAVDNAHIHSNKAILDTYYNSNADISTAISNTHIHANFALLETYTNTNAAISYALSIAHLHSNYSLIDSLTGFTNTDILNAVNNQHAILSIGTANGLSLNIQELSLDLADTDTTGALSYTDWNTFNSKLTSTDTLNAIKDLVLTEACLIYGTTSTTANILTKGLANQILSMNSSADGLEWINNVAASSGGYFEVPLGYTAITNEIGDINNTNYPTVSDLNNLTLLEILQKMLFEEPSIPDFIVPVETATYSLSGNYIEKGSTQSITITPTFTSETGSVSYHAIVNGSPTYTLDGSPYTNPTSTVFTDSSAVFVTTQPYIPNGEGESAPEYTLLANGVTVYADEYNGAASGNATTTKTYTIVDPYYIGTITAGTSTYPTAPTDTEAITGTTKTISTLPSTSNLTFTGYTGAIDTHKYIVIYYEDDAEVNTISSIKYVQGGNAEVIGSFTNTLIEHTRPDSTTVTYRLYYALNSYNAGETVTYTITF